MRCGQGDVASVDENSVKRKKKKPLLRLFLFFGASDRI